MRTKKRITLAFISLGILFVITYPFFASTYLVHIGVFVAINAIAVLGLGVLMGFAGQVSLGQAAFYGIGAYTSALLAVNYGLPFYVTMPIAILISALAGLFVGIPTLRVTGLYLVMTTIGINEIVRLVMINWKDLTNGSQGVLRIPTVAFGPLVFNSTTSYYYLAIGFLSLFIFITWRFISSRAGLYLRALQDSEIATKMVGIDTTYYKTLAFVISATWAGVAGALYAHYVGYIHPDNFKLEISVILLIMTIFGGGRSIAGMLLATAFLTGATEYLRNIGEYRMVAYGILILVVMIYLPHGIGPLLEKIPEALVREPPFEPVTPAKRESKT